MKVKEVIEALEQCDPEAEAVYAIDDEGNAFHKVYSCGTIGIYTIDGEFIPAENLAEWGYTEDDGEKAVCIN